MTEPGEPGAGHRRLNAMPAVTCSAWLGVGGIGKVIEIDSHATRPELSSPSLGRCFDAADARWNMHAEQRAQESGMTWPIPQIGSSNEDREEILPKHSSDQKYDDSYGEDA